jgi:hypothetical protein
MVIEFPPSQESIQRALDERRATRDRIGWQGPTVLPCPKCGLEIDAKKDADWPRTYARHYVAKHGPMGGVS